MKANASTACWAHTAASSHASSEGHEQYLAEYLDAYVLENYGPPWVAEFIQEALHDMPYRVAQQIAIDGEKQCPKGLESMGITLDAWIGGYARMRATQVLAPRPGSLASHKPCC
ncbi:MULTISPECIES: hypothetical protein [Delftia]|uniref:hypothetical protein n=1 Tax=Delftia TaxID=80865 RepID=UPI00020E8671|nr:MULTISPECIES: hypothetical protein [Delftia]AEF91057.1 hypothetical protein DelCs14_4074 [Delftia sp. Cs1-4]MCG3783927.1 hypothetical protein [Delftia acidovorans]